MTHSGEKPATPFDAALSVASHARALGFRRIAVRQSKASRSCYVWFTWGNARRCIRCSDHVINVGVFDFNLSDLADVSPAVTFMRALKAGLLPR